MYPDVGYSQTIVKGDVIPKWYLYVVKELGIMAVHILYCAGIINGSLVGCIGEY